MRAGMAVEIIGTAFFPSSRGMASVVVMPKRKPRKTDPVAQETVYLIETGEEVRVPPTVAARIKNPPEGSKKSGRYSATKPTAKKGTSE